MRETHAQCVRFGRSAVRKEKVHQFLVRIKTVATLHSLLEHTYKTFSQSICGQVVRRTANVFNTILGYRKVANSTEEN